MSADLCQWNLCHLFCVWKENTWVGEPDSEGVIKDENVFEYFIQSGQVTVKILRGNNAQQTSGKNWEN